MANQELIVELRGEHLRAMMSRLLMLTQRSPLSPTTTLSETLEKAGITDLRERTILRAVGRFSNDIRDEGIPLEKVKYLKVFWVPEDPASMEYEIDLKS